MIPTCIFFSFSSLFRSSSMTGMTKASVFPLPVTCSHHGKQMILEMMAGHFLANWQVQASFFFCTKWLNSPLCLLLSHNKPRSVSRFYAQTAVCRLTASAATSLLLMKSGMQADCKWERIHVVSWMFEVRPRRNPFQVVQSLPAPESCVWISASWAFVKCCGLVWRANCPKCLLSCCPCWKRTID